MYGVIYMWRVRLDRLVEANAMMKEVLRAERERCPEVLLNLTLGPAADGTCGEIQIYSDGAASRDFGARIEREDAELTRLWSCFGEFCEPDGGKVFRFENLEFLGDSFVRDRVAAVLAGLG